jgi:hypothetical protein
LAPGLHHPVPETFNICMCPKHMEQPYPGTRCSKTHRRRQNTVAIPNLMLKKHRIMLRPPQRNLLSFQHRQPSNSNQEKILPATLSRRSRWQQRTLNTLRVVVNRLHHQLKVLRSRRIRLSNNTRRPRTRVSCKRHPVKATRTPLQSPRRTRESRLRKVCCRPYFHFFLLDLKLRGIRRISPSMRSNTERPHTRAPCRRYPIKATKTPLRSP